ncbi:MAG: DUF3857 domain-containing protein [Chitinophagaceae bacterium]|nr:DUF3857 domain-containing protein [Chitinophagaceae bacterium]
MRKHFAVVFVCALFFASDGFAQDKVNVKFGSVSEKDFATTVYSIDSNANAVVIADVGSSAIEGNSKGWFSLVYKRYKRVHILNKNGYDIANVSIGLYSDGEDEEQLDKLKAVTYNLENGKVVETKLDVKANLFKDKINKNLVVKKFTFPNIKEGSIIEFEYTIISDYLQNLQPWEFQGGYPRLWSEYNLSLPEFFGYVFLTQGYKSYDIKTSKDRMESFRISDSRGVGATDRVQFSANVTDHRWVIKNVTALKEESFTSTIDNHISKLEFQLSEFRQPLTYRRIMHTWDKVADDMLKSESFALQISKDNGWLKDIIDPLKKNSPDKTALAQNIFEYVRDNFTCTDHSDLFLDQTLKNVVKTRNGTVAEINMLLTAMLKHEDIDASPVILSTRANGFTYSLYPLITQYNYVITRAVIGDKIFFLDASEPRLGFGYLPLRCYNGHARVINPEAEAIEINADAVNETKVTSAFVINDEKGNMIGSMQYLPGYYESFTLRNRINEKGKDELLKEIKKDFGVEVEVSNLVIDSLNKYNEPISIKYDFDIKAEMEDIIYLNPMFGEGIKENPFKSAVRNYPVEMPYAWDQTYNLQLEIPAGYVVDELPASVIVKLNEADEGLFEYRISKSGGSVAFRSRLRLSRAYFLPEEYEMLREFFNLVVKKHAEQIVFKKKP